MRAFVVVALLAAPAFAQTLTRVELPTKADWVGPLEFDNPDAHLIVPTITSLTIDGDTVTGEFVTMRPGTMSGNIRGTISPKGQMRATLQLYANGKQRNADGTDTRLVERCQAEGILTGQITPSGVIRLAARELRSDTLLNQLKVRNCTNPQRVTWTLQRRHED